jgi:ribosomal protein S27AE
VDEEAAERLPPVNCPKCGTVMTHHADKEVSSVPPLEEVTVVAALSCSNCGAQKAMVTSVTG